MGRRAGWGINVSMALLLALGCGSRTSMLDSDAYTDDGDDDVSVSGTGGKGSVPSPPTPAKGGTGPSGGTTSRGGQPARGGQPSGGFGATAGAFPTAGAAAGGAVGTGGTGVSTGGSSTSPGSTTLTTCANYCKGYSNTCAAELAGRDCVTLCAAEVDGFGKACQKLGLRAVKCLTPFFQKPDLTCGEATSQGLNRCGAGVNRFQECKGNVAPTPVPPPPPPPPPPPSNCSGFASGDTQTCKLGLMCIDGNYNVDCQYLKNGYYTCNCYFPTGATGNVQVPGTGAEFACNTAAQYCSFPGY